jgi:hypothetical protein
VRGLDLERICSFRYETTVGNDNAVRLAGLIFDIAPGPRGRTYAKARVEVHQLLDGTWRLYVKDELVASKPASEPKELKPLKRRKRSATDKAFQRAVRTLETQATPVPRRVSRRSAGPKPFNAFGQLVRRRKSKAARSPPHDEGYGLVDSGPGP